MKTYYGIFFFHKGQYGVLFADSSLATCGDTLDEALEMAIDGLSMVLGSGTKGGEYQDPLQYDQVLKSDVYKETSAQVDWIEIFPVIPDPLLIAQEKRRSKTDEEYIRCNLTIPKSALNIIDSTAKAKGLNRSNFLVSTALEAIQKERLTT